MHVFPEAQPAPSLRDCTEDDVRRLVDHVEPDLIIHTAAISDIGACERDPEASWRANVALPLLLVSTGVRTLLFSSDQVYGGSPAEGPYTEEEAAPVHIYARHKLEMEQRALALNPSTVILRATWMYDLPVYGLTNRGNYLMNMLTRREMRFSFSQQRAVTYMRDVALRTREAVRLPGGVYNFGSENPLSMLSLSTWLKEELFLSVSFSDAGPIHHLWMNCAKAASFGIRFPTSQEGLHECISDYGLK